MSVGRVLGKRCDMVYGRMVNRAFTTELESQVGCRVQVCGKSS